MNFRLICTILIACVMTMPVQFSSAQDANNADVGTQLEQIMQLLKKQQGQIDSMQKQLQQQQEVIDNQQERLLEQDKQLEEQQRVIEEQPTVNDAVEAAVRLNTGKKLEHIGRFEVRRREAKPYYLKAIEEYMVVLKQHPTTPQAPECAFRTGRIYHQYLDEYKKAREFYDLFMKEYPDSRFSDEVRKALADLQGK